MNYLLRARPFIAVAIGICASFSFASRAQAPDPASTFQKILEIVPAKPVFGVSDLDDECSIVNLVWAGHPVVKIERTYPSGTPFEIYYRNFGLHSAQMSYEARETDQEWSIEGTHSKIPERRKDEAITINLREDGSLKAAKITIGGLSQSCTLSD